MELLSNATGFILPIGHVRFLKTEIPLTPAPITATFFSDDSAVVETDEFVAKLGNCCK